MRMADEGPGGFFGNLMNNALLKLVEVSSKNVRQCRCMGSNRSRCAVAQVKEKEGSRKKLQQCVFCEKGVIKCEACMGTGKDIALGVGDCPPPILPSAIGLALSMLAAGECFLCNGKGKRQCEICLGMGMVDKVRRGGTDTQGQWVGSDKASARSPCRTWHIWGSCHAGPDFFSVI